MIASPRAGLWLLRRVQRLRSRHSIRPSSNSAKSGGPNSSNSASPSTAPSNTIPGPTWFWLEPFQVPLRHYTRLHQRRPYIMQLSSTLVIYFLGDLSAQRISSSSADRDSGKTTYNPYQTMRALTIGVLASIPAYRWFLWLGNQFNTFSKPLSIGLKVVINQVAFTPVFNTYFFGMQMLLSNAGWEDGKVRWKEIKERITETVPRSWVNSWKVWPVVTAISFLWVRVELRSIFAGVIAIGWQTYLSLLNQRAARAQAHQTPTLREAQQEMRPKPRKDTEANKPKTTTVQAQA